MMLVLIQTAPAPGAGSDFFGGAKIILDQLAAKIIAELQNVLPMRGMMEALYMVMVGIFLWHIGEVLIEGTKKGHPIPIMAAVKEAFFTHGMRLAIFCTLAVGSLALTPGGWQLMDDASASHSWLNIGTQNGTSTVVADLGNTMTQYLGTNATRTLTNPDGTTQVVFIDDAPCMQTLDTGIKDTDNAIMAMSASNVFDEIGTQVQKVMDTRPAGSTAASWGINAANPLIVQTLILKPLVDGFFWVVNWFTFVWSQWTLCRTLLLQALFIRLSWHVGLYFMPFFIMLAYFRSTQGFLIRLLTNYVALMVAAYVLGALASALFSPDTWLGTIPPGVAGQRTGGIIQAAFANVTLGDGAKGYTMGSFPWLSTLYATQIARGQLVWLMGAIGILLSQIYEMVRGILDGSFRSFFQPGNAGRSTVFGG